MTMIDSIMTIPLLIGILYLIFFVYRKVRVDLFRDKIFMIRRSLFLIAADNQEEFIKNNSSYRFFESILNDTLSYTEEFSLITSFLDATIRFNYAKMKKIENFDFDNVKNIYLEKIKSQETKKKVADLLNEFQCQYMLFLLTRTFLGTILFFSVFILFMVYTSLKMVFERNIENLKRSILVHNTIIYFKPNKVMSNSRFAFAASMF